MVNQREENQTSNMIILIGNGFDLAHELKTNFSDFAEYYVDQKIIPALVDEIRSKTNSPLFKKRFHGIMSNRSGYNNSPKDYYDYIWNYGLRVENNREKLKNYISQNSYELVNILSNELLGKLYGPGYTNWFDVEHSYFHELKLLKNKSLKNKTPKINTEEVSKLNKEFDEIKRELEIYLSTIRIEKNEQIQNFIDLNIKNALNIYLINFNYTNSVEQYLEESRKNKNVEINYIHGKLDKENIIFGYGNDQNQVYQEIKDLEIDTFLHHFKTFKYMRDGNYMDIFQNAIDKFDEYEVLVLGHSLGATDKTLLDEIFNNDKCVKISFFKRRDLENNPDDLAKAFDTLLYSAGRIVENEKKLRKKVLNFKDSSFFP